MSGNITYVILNDEQQNSRLGDTLSSSAVVSQVLFESSSQLLGGRSVPSEQIRDFRASRLGGSDGTSIARRSILGNFSAYVTNIPDAPESDEGASLHSVLRGAVTRYTDMQLEQLERLFNSREAFEENNRINEAMSAAVDSLVRRTNESMPYATRVYSTINRANTNTSSGRPVTMDTSHLYLVPEDSEHSEYMQTSILSAYQILSSNPLAARIFNVFLALGLPFMDFVVSRYLELASGPDYYNSLETQRHGFNVPVQMFFAMLRQAMSGLAILFIGLEHFVSADLETFLGSMEQATRSAAVVLHAARGYVALNSTVVNAHIERALNRVHENRAASQASSWGRTRAYFNAYLGPLFSLLHINPSVTLGLIASAVYVYQVLQRSGVLTDIPVPMLAQLTRRAAPRNFGPVTRFFTDLPAAFREFLKNFRHL